MWKCISFEASTRDFVLVYLVDAVIKIPKHYDDKVESLTTHAVPASNEPKRFKLKAKAESIFAHRLVDLTWKSKLKAT